jgi:hypothetical protein
VAWEARNGKGSYYYRCRRVDGRRVKEYFGKGSAAQLAADLDRLGRLKRRAAWAAWEAEEARVREVVRSLRELEADCELIAKAVLLVAGYHRHHHQWRKWRERQGIVGAG